MLVATTLFFITVVFAQGFWNPLLNQRNTRHTLFAMSQQLTQQELISSVQQAIEHHKNGNVEEAIIYYEKALPQLAGSTKASLSGNVGALYMSMGEYERAKGHFIASVEADPNNPSAHFNLAVVLTSKLGEHGKAIKHCGKAINLDPNNHKAHHLMGNIMQSIGRQEEASKYFLAAENIAIQSSQTSDPAKEDNRADQGILGKLPLYGAAKGDSFSVMIGGATYTVECLSDSPLIFIVDSLITEEECKHIQNRASKLLEKSYVMGGDQDSHETAQPAALNAENSAAAAIDPALYRSSYNAWLSQDSMLNNLQVRVAAVLGLPAAYLKQKSEELQVVRYEPGGQFKVHQDSSAFNTRLVTALLYLNDVGDGSGGATWFPYAGEKALEVNSAQEEQDGSADPLSPPEMVELAVSGALSVYEQHSMDSDANTESAHEQGKLLPGLHVTPRLGRAVIFFNHLASGAIDPKAVHAGLPVHTGSTERAEKWVANYWVEYEPKLLSELIK